VQAGPRPRSSLIIPAGPDALNSRLPAAAAAAAGCRVRITDRKASACLFVPIALEAWVFVMFFFGRRRFLADACFSLPERTVSITLVAPVGWRRRCFWPCAGLVEITPGRWRLDRRPLRRAAASDPVELHACWSWALALIAPPNNDCWAPYVVMTPGHVSTRLLIPVLVWLEAAAKFDVLSRRPSYSTLAHFGLRPLGHCRLPGLFLNVPPQASL